MNIGKNEEINIAEIKKIAAYKACEHIKNKMLIGLGTGSTAYYVVERCAALYKDGMDIKVVCTSKQTEKLAEDFGLNILSINEVDYLDIAIDGVDEIDPSFNAVKGGGAALFREKVVASLAKKLIWVMDSSKLTDKLGNFPLPVEVSYFGLYPFIKKMNDFGLKASLRLNGREKIWRSLSENKKNILASDLFETQVLKTDNANFIVDLFNIFDYNLNELDALLKKEPAVIENGLFLNMCNSIVVGYPDLETREFINLGK